MKTKRQPRAPVTADIGPETLLSDYVAVYLASRADQRNRTATARNNGHLTGLASVFSRALGRPATIADLTINKLNPFLDRLVATCRSPATVYEHRRRFMTLLRHVIWHRLAVGITPQMPLREFYRQAFAPLFLGESADLDKYRRAVEEIGSGWAVSDLTSPTSLEACKSHPLRRYIKRVWKLAYDLDLVGPWPKAVRPRIERVSRPRRRSLWNQAAIEPVAKGEAPLTVRQLYVHFYRPLRLRHSSPCTEHRFKTTVDAFARFLGREPLLTDFEDDQVGCFLASAMKHGWTPSTANTARSGLLALWRLAARKRFVDAFPDVGKLKVPARIPKVWTQSELARLFAALAKEPGKIAGVPAGLWWVALHHVLWWSAERISAVMQLRWSDIDLESGWLIVPAEFRKRRTADKATELPPEAIDALKAIYSRRRKLVFPWPYTHGDLWPRYRHIRQRAGLATDRASGFHRMRRSAASYFEAAGGNATELLGHSARRVTMCYLSPSVVKPKQAAEILFDPRAAPIGGAV
ncbi:MAG TPA: site-specific integrase [Pirellulales bacterium]|jgi:integrase